MPLAPTRPTNTAVEAVIDYIKAGVRTQLLSGGSRIPTEDQICEAVGVSRTPVREALKVLQAMGVLEIRRGIGTFMKPQGVFALDYLMAFQANLEKVSPRKLFETRLMIERTAAEMAAQYRTDAHLEAMRAANHRMEVLSNGDPVDLDALTQADVCFHLVIFDACGNELIATIGKFMTELFAPWIKEGHARVGGMRSVRNHALIIEMIETRNSSGAREAAFDRSVHDGLEKWQEALEIPADILRQKTE